MQILDIKGKKWMVGLEWEILPGDSTIKQEAKEVAEKTNSGHGLIVDYESTYAIGLAKKPTKDPSAALYLALANQNMRENGGSPDYPDWIVLEEVGDDKYWMAVIKSGIPAPQFDAVLSITEIKDRITELLINDTYTVYTSAGEIIAIFDGIKHIENRSLNDLTSDIKTKIRFTKLLGIPNSVIYAGIAVIVLCGIGYGALQFVEGKNIQEKATMLARKQERERQEKENKFKADMATYEKTKKEKEEKEINNVVLGLSGNPSKILSAFYENIGSTEIGTHGWNLKNIECYFEVTPSDPITANDPNIKYPRIACDYLYERTELATTRMLLEDYPNAKLNGDKAVVTKVVEIDPVYIEKADNSILNSLKHAKNWGFDVQSQLQLLKVANIDHEIKGSSEIIFKNPGKPLTPSEVASGKQPNPEEVNKLGIGVGEIIIKGNTFDWVKELADNVDFSGTGLRKVKFDVKTMGEFSWEAKFNYYIKTNEGGIGSSSSIGLSPTSDQAPPLPGQQPLNRPNQ